MGGGYHTLQDFVLCMGLICFSDFGCLLPDGRGEEDHQATKIHTYICLLFGTGVSLCLVLSSLYNVRAYVCVRLNVYKYKIMLISVN